MPSSTQVPASVYSSEAGSDTESMSSALTSCSSFFKDKCASNKFQFRLRKAPPSVREKWQALNKGGESAKLDFVKSLMSVARGDYSDMCVRSERSVTTHQGKKTGARWYSWAEASAIEGEEQLTAMVKANTVTHRDHPKIPPGSVEWPRNLQVWLSLEKNSIRQCEK